MTMTAAGRFTEARAYLELLMAVDTAVPGWRSLEPEQRWNWFQALYDEPRTWNAATASGRAATGGKTTSRSRSSPRLGRGSRCSTTLTTLTGPQGKARLLLRLPIVRELVRGGAQHFDPGRDRPAFEQDLLEQLGC
jgi:hypothetical protein